MSKYAIEFQLPDGEWDRSHIYFKTLERAVSVMNRLNKIGKENGTIYRVVPLDETTH